MTCIAGIPSPLLLSNSYRYSVGFGHPFFFSFTFTKTHTICSLIIFSFTDCQEFSLSLGTDLIRIKPTRDLTQGVVQGQRLGWELQRKPCTAEGVETEYRQTALWSHSGA